MTSKSRQRQSPGLPSFDTTRSFEAAAALLKQAKVPFALIGRVAVWQYVPAEGQLFTKDVDFAVPYGHAEVIAKRAVDTGYKVKELTIGGFSVKAPGVSIDFIDRRRGYATLFADAVAAANAGRKTRKFGSMRFFLVPRDFLVAMKLATAEQKDERDVEELLRVTKPADYAKLRLLVVKYLGFYAGERLDKIALAMGHLGPHKRLSRYRR